MILDQIVAHKQQELERSKEAMPLAALKERVGFADTARGFRHALAQSSDIALIAEVKKESPSAGLIRKDFDPVEIAKIYEDCGAAAVSVLTDEHFFAGSLSIMQQVKQAVSIPVLRKDFIIDPYQLYEARAFGADAVLLIAAILSDEKLRRLLALCKELELDALVEVHDVTERDRAVKAGAEIIGINNRDLRTFAVDLSTTMNLAPGIPEQVICVSESGIKTPDDVNSLRQAGIDAMLVGTALMEAENIEAKIKELLNPG
ncbi:MAG: indole-3-glycerol phosphate synthase TrpC [Desulfobacterales bacterium]|nr:indole-3-glycerol phosphate synthase TrpC [Desulfobacterales bacterium]